MAVKILSPSSFRQQQARGAQGAGTYRGYLNALSRHTGLGVNELLAQRDTNAVFIPSAQAESAAILRNAGYDTGRVNARTGSIQSALAPYPASARSAYSSAANVVKGVGSGLASGLTSSGAQLGSDISGKLTGIQAPGQAVSQYGGGTAATGAAAGGAVGALSSAEVSRLNSFGTAAEVYASALPRLAALAGEAEKRQILQNYAQELADKQAAAQQAEQSALLENRRYYAQLSAQQAQQKYQRSVDAYNRARQSRLDSVALQAARQTYGLKVAGEANSAARAQTSAGNLTERERHDRAMEAQAARNAARAARSAQQKEENQSQKSASARAKYFEGVRKDAFKTAAGYAATKNVNTGQVTKLPRAQAMTRLRSQYGRILAGHGFSAASINAMLNAALVAAGY